MATTPAPFELRLSPRVVRQLRRIPEQDRGRVEDLMERLAITPRPRGTAKVRPSTLRVKVGRWRVFYQVDDDLRRILVTDVLLREKDTYDRV